jgi:hypothetical protein
MRPQRVTPADKPEWGPCRNGRLSCRPLLFQTRGYRFIEPNRPTWPNLNVLQYRPRHAWQFGDIDRRLWGLAQRECRPRISALKKSPGRISQAVRPGVANFMPAPLECLPRTASAVCSMRASDHAAIYIGTEWPCGCYVVQRVSVRCGGPLGYATASLPQDAGNSPVPVGACLPDASVLGVAQLRVGSGIQQRNWSLSRRVASSSSAASCRRMGGFPGPKRSLVLGAIILAIGRDQVERDQGGTWKRSRAPGSGRTPLAVFASHSH